MFTAIVGINWGDEGKGRMVDLLSADQQLVVRYQGGNNAGHTVVNQRGKFILNLLPSGILRPEVVSVMGPGMVVDVQHLTKEIAALEEKGVSVSPEHLKISDRAVICLPWHVQQDCLEEVRLGAAAYGSTHRGIAPVYGDRYMKKGVRMGDLRDRDSLAAEVRALTEWKNLTLTGVYHAEPVKAEEVMDWLDTYAMPFLPYLCDTGLLLEEADKAGKNVMFEAQLGALRDVDFGIIPFTSSSCTLAAFAPIGAGLPGRKLDTSIGIMKAYSTCVGEGPFTVEMSGAEAEALRAAGGEYGAATGRPRRVGGFDVPASRYGVRMQGADALALTKLDVLSYMDSIPVCTAYDVRGCRTEAFPMGQDLRDAKPVFESVPGWKTDISGCRKWEELPAAARAYVELLEKAVDCPIRYISVGADRDACITREV